MFGPMKPGALLRVGFYLIAMWSVFTAITTGSYQLVYLFNSYDLGAGFLAQSAAPAVLTHFVVPLCFACLLFVAAGRIARGLLGPAAEETTGNGGAHTRALLRVGLKLLGCYLFVTYGAALLATIVELFQSRIRSSPAVEAKAMVDLVANVVGVAAGSAMAVKTDLLIGRLGVAAPSQNGSPAGTDAA